MKQFRNLNPALYIALAAALVAAVWLNIVRHGIERENNSVEMAMEHEGLRKFAAQEGVGDSEIFRMFRDAGINSMMVFDTTLERLARRGRIKAIEGKDLLKAKELGGDLGAFAAVPEADLAWDAVYVTRGKLEEAFSETEEDLLLRYGRERVKAVSEEPRIVRVIGKTDRPGDERYDLPLDLMQAPLGIASEDLREAMSLGFRVIARPANYADATEEKIDSFFKRLDKAGAEGAAYMPCGTEALGYPGKLEYVAGKMRDRQMKLVMLEHYSQLQFAPVLGLVSLAEMNGYRAARAYVVDPLEQRKLAVPQALRRWALTDAERNVRVNYIRPFLKPQEGKGALRLNLDYVAAIRDSVLDRGFAIGEAGLFSAPASSDAGQSGKEQGGPALGQGGDKALSYSPYFPSRLLLALAAAGVAAGCVIYLSLVFGLPKGRQAALFACLTAASALALVFGRGLLTRQALALAAASVFPVLSLGVMMEYFSRSKPRPGLFGLALKAVVALFAAIVLSLAGAALLSALLADSRFMLEIDIYRGVKLTFVAPVILTALLYAAREGLLGSDEGGLSLSVLKGKALGFLRAPVTVGASLCALAAVVALYFFLGRSGHSAGISVPALELKLRYFLEQVMYARPRSKEFLIGHPAFFLAVMAELNRMTKSARLLLWTLAAIGQGSLVETFCHMRTPVFMSVARAFDGYAAALPLGLAATAFMWLGLRLWTRMGKGGE